MDEFLHVGRSTKAYPVVDLLSASGNVVVDRLGGVSVAVYLDTQSG